MKTQVALRVHEDVTVSDTNGSGYMRMLAERALYNWLDVCVCVCICVCVCVRERERERTRERESERERERERAREREKERESVC